MPDSKRHEKVGVLHIHSTYSADGTLTLAECQRVFKRRGYDFIAVTEHAQDMDAVKMERFVADCRALSDEHFCIIPGLELEFYRDTNKTHILALGITDYIAESSPEKVLDRVHAQGGLTVFAHPKLDRHQRLIERLVAHLDGIEVWNSKYNGHFAFPTDNFTLLQRLQEVYPRLYGFAGIDFHWQSQYKDLHLAVRAEDLHPLALVRALGAGDFRMQQGRAVIDASGAILTPQAPADRLLGTLQVPLMQGFHRTRRVVKSIGIPLPTFLKRGVRRLIF